MLAPYYLSFNLGPLVEKDDAAGSNPLIMYTGGGELTKARRVEVEKKKKHTHAMFNKCMHMARSSTSSALSFQYGFQYSSFKGRTRPRPTSP